MTSQNFGDQRKPSHIVSDALVAVACAFGPMLWRVLAGAGRWPAGDAWAYERIFRTFHHTGRVVLVGWNDINLIGMLPITELWVRVVGDGPHQLHLLGSVMGVVFLLGVRRMLSVVGVQRRTFPLAVAGLSVGFVGVSGTYLSDLFCMAAAMWGLAIAVGLAETPTTERRAVVLSVIAALCLAYAFLIRQQALVPAIAAWSTLPRRRRRNSPAWVFSAVYVVAVVPTYLWRRSLDHGGAETIGLHVRSAIEGWISLWVTLGLVGLPFVLRRTAEPRRSTVRIAMLATPILLMLAGTTIKAAGSLARGQSLAGELARLGGPLGWSAAAVVVAAATLSWSRILSMLPLPRADPAYVLQRALFVLVTGEALIEAASGVYFTRYSLCTTGVLVCLLARHNASTRQSSESVEWNAPSVAVLLAVGFGAYFVVDLSLRWIGGAEQAAAVAECAGIDKADLDGGFVWNGVYTSGFVDSSDIGGATPSDGLPATTEQSVFVGMRREAVLLSHLPADAGSYAVAGPFLSHGVLPGLDERTWLVARPTYATAINACRAK